MKAFVVCAAFLVSAVQAEPSSTLVHAALRAKWSSFKAQNKRTYNPQEEETRLNTFVRKTIMIEEHNARYHQGLESFEMGHNDMSDMTPEEIRETRMGIVMPLDAEQMFANLTMHQVPSGVSAPSNIDWRQHSCVTHVKNQGGCGSCYAFSAIGAVETAWCLKHGKQLLDLSEQFLVDCAGRGCNGGWMGAMFDYLRDHNGAVPQGDYPYKAKANACQYTHRRIAWISGHKMVNRGDENALAHALSTVGTIAIAYNSDFEEHHHYKRGILDTNKCEKKVTHGVLLVGFGSENGKNYWLVKNSWGAGWGEGGYFRMIRGKNLCGVADWAVYPIAK